MSQPSLSVAVRTEQGPWCSAPSVEGRNSTRAALITVIFGAVPNASWCEGRPCAHYVNAEQLSRYVWWHTHLGFQKILVIAFFNDTVQPPSLEDVYPAHKSCIVWWQARGWLNWRPMPWKPAAVGDALEMNEAATEKLYKPQAVSRVYREHQHLYDWIGVSDTDELIYVNLPVRGRLLRAGETILSAALRAPITQAHGDQQDSRPAVTVIMPVFLWHHSPWLTDQLSTIRCRWPHAYHCPDREPAFDRSEQHYLHTALTGKYDMLAFEWKTIHRTGLYNLTAPFSFHAPPAAARFVPFFTQEHSRSSTLPRRSMFEPHGLRVAHLARPRPGTWSGFLPPITHRPERIANDTALVQLMKVMVRSAARQSPTSEVWFRQDRGAYVVDK